METLRSEMCLGGVAWHFLAMFPPSVRLLSKNVKNRAFKWPSFMQHELTQIMTILLDWHARGKTKFQFLSTAFLKPAVRFSSPALSDIPRQIPQLFAYFQVLYKTFQELKQSNPIKDQNLNLSSNSKLFSSLSPAQVCLRTLLHCQMPRCRTNVQNIRNPHRQNFLMFVKHSLANLLPDL